MTTIVGISGSLRRGSYNTSLLRAAAQLMPNNAQLRIETIREIPLRAVVLAAALLVSRAQGIFDEAGTLTATAMKDRLREFLHGFVDFAKSHNH